MYGSPGLTPVGMLPKGPKREEQGEPKSPKGDYKWRNWLDVNTRQLEQQESSWWPLWWWSSLVSQLVKNLSSMQEALVQFLGREDPLEKGFPSWVSLMAQLVKNPSAMRRPGFDPWVGKMPCRWERLPTLVFWPREFHRLFSPWGSQRVRQDWATFTIMIMMMDKAKTME